jgi:hypothetical protein
MSMTYFSTLKMEEKCSPIRKDASDLHDVINQSTAVRTQNPIYLKRFVLSKKIQLITLYFLSSNNYQVPLDVNCYPDSKTVTSVKTYEFGYPWMFLTWAQPGLFWGGQKRLFSTAHSSALRIVDFFKKNLISGILACEITLLYLCL